MRKDTSVPAEGRHGVVAVGVVDLPIKVLFSIPHLEEVLVLSTSERVVPVVTFVDSRPLRLLDIPENMVGNGVEDTLLASGLEAVLIGILEILDVVIPLALLENSKLFVNSGVEVIDLSLALAPFQLCHHGHTPSILVFGIHVPNLLFGIHLFILGLHVLFVIKSPVGELRVGHSVHKSAIGVSWSTSEWISHPLHQAALLVACSLSTGQGCLLGSACVVGGEALLVVVEILVLLLVGGEVLLGHRLVVSDVDICELLLLLIVVAALDVLGELLGVGLLHLGIGLVGGIQGLPGLEGLEAKSMLPVPEELLDLLRLVEMRLGQLLAPLWRMTEVSGMCIWLKIWVDNDLLVI